jgi:hypothetical protein
MTSSGRYSQMQAPIRVVHSNLDQEIIQITEDKIRLVLNDHLKKLQDKQRWIAPLGICLTVFITLVTSTFKDTGLKAATWEAIFWLVGMGSLLWFVVTAIGALRSPTIDDVVERIKNKGGIA